MEGQADGYRELQKSLREVICSEVTLAGRAVPSGIAGLEAG